MSEHTFSEHSIKVNGLDIAYQRHGESSAPALVLIHGLSTPLTGWPRPMLEGLVVAGFQLLLMDNRDIGRSEQLNHLPLPNMLWSLLKLKMGLPIKAPYQLDDMMQDVLALLDALNLSKVHVIGASMGGMIAQLLAIHHPERVSTLTSIMSTTGDKTLPPMNKDIRQALGQKPAVADYAARQAYHIKKWQLIGSPDYPASDAYLQDYVDSMLQRGITAKGTLRQMLAIMAADSRAEALAGLRVPTLVIHGDRDGLVNIAGGRATAAAIPKAALKIYPGMGHDLPVELIPMLVQDIAGHVYSNLSEQR
jgi:pimeloyl-ACP methyl ester carboxylesterase